MCQNRQPPKRVACSWFPLKHPTMPIFSKTRCGYRASHHFHCSRRCAVLLRMHHDWNPVVVLFFFPGDSRKWRAGHIEDVFLDLKPQVKGVYPPKPPSKQTTNPNRQEGTRALFRGTSLKKCKRAPLGEEGKPHLPSAKALSSNPLASSIYLGPLPKPKQ